MVTSAPALDLQRSFLYPFGSPVAVRKPEREWIFDVKNDLAVYLGDPSESVRGALVYYPSTGAIATRGDKTPLVVSPEDFHRYESARTSLKDPSGNNDLTIETHEAHDLPELNEVNHPVAIYAPKVNLRIFKIGRTLISASFLRVMRTSFASTQPVWLKEIQERIC